MYEVCYKSQTSLMKSFCCPPAAGEEHRPGQRADGTRGMEMPPFCTRHPVKIVMDHGKKRGFSHQWKVSLSFLLGFPFFWAFP